MGGLAGIFAKSANALEGGSLYKTMPQAVFAAPRIRALQGVRRLFVCFGMGRKFSGNDVQMPFAATLVMGAADILTFHVKHFKKGTRFSRVKRESSSLAAGSSHPRQVRIGSELIAPHAPSNRSTNDCAQSLAEDVFADKHEGNPMGQSFAGEWKSGDRPDFFHKMRGILGGTAPCRG